MGWYKNSLIIKKKFKKKNVRGGTDNKERGKQNPRKTSDANENNQSPPTDQCPASPR